MFYQPEESVDLLRTAIAEIKRRLVAGDAESAISICDATEIALEHGIGSAEMQAFQAIESARLA